MVSFVKQIMGHEKAKRAFWSLVIMAFAYLLIVGRNGFGNVPYL